MITLLEKLFMKDRDSLDINAIRQKYGILCGSLGIALNIILFIGKFFAGTVSNSIAITADAFNNLSDAGSSVVTLVGFKLAGQKPDPSHPFGHGRIEYLSGLLVSGAILIMAFELVKSSFLKISNPEPVHFTFTSFVILVCSISVKLYMAYYNKRVGKKINSAAMNATAIDSLSDTLATFAVLVSSFIGMFTGVSIDGYCGILVGFFILYAGIRAAKETLDPLLGQPPRPSFVKEIETIVLSHSDILGIHDLIVHDYGPGRIMLSLHAEVPATGNLLNLHDTIDNIETELHEKLFVDAVIHMDPTITDNEEIDALKALSLEAVKSVDPCITLHDFRIVVGPTHTNIIFDIVVPFQFRITDEEIREQITAHIHDFDSSYYTIIQIDKNYVNEE